MADTLRIKRYMIDDGLIVAILNWGRCLSRCDAWRIPILPEVPEGAHFNNAVWVPQRRCWELYVEHASFDEIHPAADIPYAGNSGSMTDWQVQTVDDVLDSIDDEQICAYLQQHGYSVGVGS